MTMDPRQVEGPLEAVLLMAEQAMTSAELAQAVQAPVPVVDQALASIVAFYDEHQRGFELRHVGGGWRYWTRAEHAELLSAWVVSGQQNRLSQAALETLSVVAYLQPISRSRIAAIRGVSVDQVVRTLLARDLVEEVPADERGHVVLLRTTDHFLERMGLAGLDELPPLAPHLPDATLLERELSSLADTVGGDGVPPDVATTRQGDESKDHDE